MHRRLAGALKNLNIFLKKKIKWCKDYIKIAYCIIKLLRCQDEIWLTKPSKLYVTWLSDWMRALSIFWILLLSLLDDQEEVFCALSWFDFETA